LPLAALLPPAALLPLSTHLSPPATRHEFRCDIQDHDHDHSARTHLAQTPFLLPCSLDHSLLASVAALTRRRLCPPLLLHIANLQRGRLFEPFEQRNERERSGREEKSDRERGRVEEMACLPLCYRSHIIVGEAWGQWDEEVGLGRDLPRCIPIL